MVNYYVIRNKETGFYFRGKGENRWGKYHNQASVYRMKTHAEHTLKWLLRYGEPVKIVPIQIVENPIDIAEVIRCKDCKFWEEAYGSGGKLGYCEMSVSDHGGLAIWYPDDYCSYGERKDND